MKVKRQANKNNLLRGELRLNPQGYGFFIPQEKAVADVFIPARHINFAMNGDEILVASRKNKKDGRYEGSVVKILKRAQTKLMGRLIKHDKGYSLQVMDRGSRFTLSIPQKNLKGATPGCLAAAKILQYPAPDAVAVGEVIHVIGEEMNLQTLTEAALLKSNIDPDFPQLVKDEIQTIPQQVDKNDCDDDRRDLTHLPLITIDGITAKDFDDAVCVVKHGKNFILYVCIADVAAYVKEGSALDQEAYARGTSVYLPHLCIPMLPGFLSNGVCSLNPYEWRKTLTAEIHYDERFQLTRVLFYRSLIKSQKRATYEEVEAFFDGMEDEGWPAEVKKSLTHMKELATHLIKQAEARGSLGFDLPEAQVVFDAQGKIQNIVRSQTFFSHKLIEVFMVAANSAVASFFTVHGLPALYRVHDEPDPLKIQDFIHLLRALGLGQRPMAKQSAQPMNFFFKQLKRHSHESFLHSVFLRSLKQAFYDAENVGHYGLGLSDYCHFTSPIRRYPDLVIHRQLKGLMAKEKDGVLSLSAHELKKQKNTRVATTYSFRDLSLIGAHCSKRERDAMEAEREVMRVLKTIFMQDHAHEKFYGLISRITRQGVMVELDPYFVEGFLPLKHMRDDYYIFDEKKYRLYGRRTKKRLTIGERLWVTVDKVDVDEGLVLLNVLTDKKKRSL